MSDRGGLGALLALVLTLAGGCASAGYADMTGEVEELRYGLGWGAAPSVSDPISFGPLATADPELDRTLEGELTSEVIGDAALRRNPDVVAALERWVGFLEVEQQRTALPNPLLSYGYSSMFKMHVVELAQVVPFPLKLLAEGRAALAEARAARAAVAERANLLRQQTVAALANLYRARRELELIDANIVLMERFVDIARTRYVAGTATQSDVLRAEVEREGLRAERATFASEVEIAESALNVLLDRPADAPLGPVKVLPEPPAPEPLAVLFDRAFQQRPELEAARERWVAAEELSDRAQLEWVPDFAFGGAYVRDFGMDEDEVEATGGITLPIWVGRIRAGIRQAEANVRAAEADARSARNTVLDDVRRAVARLAAATKRLQIIRDDALPRATRNVEVSEAAYVTGTLGFLELIDAQRMLLEQQLELERSRAARTMAGAELRRAVGEPTLPGREARP